MYYSKISCNVEKSLEKLKIYKISQMMDVDYYAIITVTNYGKIQIDGSKDYDKEIAIKDETIINLLSNKLEDICSIEEGTLYTEQLENDKYSIILVPIRHFRNYYVFTFFCKRNGHYTQREIRITEFVTSVIYENVLLDYEIVKERNYLQSIFNSTKSFIITLDLEEKVISVNKKVAKISGNRSDFIGKHISSFLDTTQYNKLKKLYKKVINNTTISGEEEFIFNEGKKYYINYSLSPMLDKDNEVVGVVALGVDVTKQKIYEKEIEQLRQYALLGEISAEVAHDIKNPLMSIRGCARLLQKKSEDKSTQTYIIPIIDQVDRINKIIEQMLSYSRLSIENGFKFVDINTMLDKCIDAVSFHKQFRYITIKKEYADDLPYIEGSDIRVQQAFMNILLNSIHAIENEGIIRIKTENIYKKKQIKISISDNGIGIDENEKEKIFEPFYTTKPQGTGLGLSIVNRVIKELGGYYDIVSSLGKGLTVKIYIPYDNNRR